MHPRCVCFTDDRATRATLSFTRYIRTVVCSEGMSGNVIIFNFSRGRVRCNARQGMLKRNEKERERKKKKKERNGVAFSKAILLLRYHAFLVVDGSGSRLIFQSCT